MDLTLGNRLRKLPGPVLVTGHTGFKGAWLTLLLEQLSVSVVGYSLPPDQLSFFQRLNRIGSIPEQFGDIRDLDLLTSFISKHKPSAVIHMAAQPLVMESYKNPRETFETNVLGTVNILESAFKEKSVQAVMVVTTDKVYRNDNQGTMFIESDALSGKDPYSASKVGAEAAIAAWQQIAKISGGPKVVSVRAGNVIGGGDWAENRLLPDIVRGYIEKKEITVRNAKSTRPWQHVLDPLHGYILALESSLDGGSNTAFNFGPNGESLNVEEIVNICSDLWALDFNFDSSDKGFAESSEANYLQLDSSLAKKTLGWEPIWSQEAAVVSTMQWWDKCIRESTSPREASMSDIQHLLESRISTGITREK